MDIKPGMKDSRGVEIDHDFTERTTFVVTPDGKIAATFSTADDKSQPGRSRPEIAGGRATLKGTKSSAN